jgi:hypothetical protein
MANCPTIKLHVSVGSFSDVSSCDKEVRFAPNSGHRQSVRPRPKSAKKRLMRCSKIDAVSQRNGRGKLPLIRPRQYDLELRENSGLCLDFDAAAMLFDDDVVAH